eukprot:NODE_8730_length_397_cov_35.675287_g7846_i0.p2 GENE.NODE_8730_length_397_cov_35.675287_g7846_i0~~NODE_8730_length_397_cov_35.675287_g7846_i0.p2  ORF type:complete len:97 (+),score=16.24 NODE_8730_length_397_cov_35.675287_g7846_i0:32-322(+)
MGPQSAGGLVGVFQGGCYPNLVYWQLNADGTFNSESETRSITGTYEALEDAITFKGTYCTRVGCVQKGRYETSFGLSEFLEDYTKQPADWKPPVFK